MRLGATTMHFTDRLPSAMPRMWYNIRIRMERLVYKKLLEWKDTSNGKTA